MAVVFKVIFCYTVYIITKESGDRHLYIYKGDIAHGAVDSAVHYRAAKHYSENLQLFVFTEDKTFFDFNIMQTGAYINDGIFMNILKDITGLEEIYTYQLFETLTMVQTIHEKIKCVKNFFEFIFFLKKELQHYYDMHLGF